jgi:peptide/nickel transport system permease protein
VIAYLIRRLLQAVIVVWLVTVLTFLLLKALPGGPVRAILGQRASDLALVTALTKQLGFDKPIWYQYWHWLDDLLHGNFGFSFQQNQTVSSLLGQRLPKTLLLLGVSTLFALIVAVPIGVAQAVRRNKAVDYLGTGFSFIFYAMPSYLLGIILVNIFGQGHVFALFPPQAAQGSSIGSFFTQFNAMVLPLATLTLITIASFSRYMRSSTLDQITQDYVRTARAKGAGERRILYRHILRNALIPIATLVGLNLPVIFSGALITEFVFNYPGMGLLFITAANTQDYPILLGVTVIVAFATVVGSLVADILYAVLDPRVRYVSA